MRDGVWLFISLLKNQILLWWKIPKQKRSLLGFPAYVCLLIIYYAITRKIFRQRVMETTKWSRSWPVKFSSSKHHLFSLHVVNSCPHSETREQPHTTNSDALLSHAHLLWRSGWYVAATDWHIIWSPAILEYQVVESPLYELQWKDDHATLYVAAK